MFLKNGHGGLKPKGLPAYREFLRSALVSSISFALDFLVCMLIVESAGLDYVAATAISFTAGTVLNYFLSLHWVFGRSGKLSRHLGFLAFIGTAAIGLLLNGLAMYCFTGIYHVHYLVSRVMSATLVFFFNFACRKFLIFADSEKGPFTLARRCYEGIKARHVRRSADSQAPRNLH